MKKRNVKECCYIKIPTDVITPQEAAKIYYYQNMAGLSEDLDNEAEQFEIKQSKLRAKLIKQFREATGLKPKTRTAVYCPSGVDDNMIIVADV